MRNGLEGDKTGGRGYDKGLLQEPRHEMMVALDEDRTQEEERGSGKVKRH